MWWMNAEQLGLWLIERLEVCEQKPSRSLRVDSGGHVGDVAPVALGKVEAVEPGPDFGVLQLVAKRNADDVDQVRIIRGRRLTQCEQRPDVGRLRMGTQHFGGGAANERIGVAQMARGQLGKWLCELSSVDEHFHAVDAQLAVGIAGAGDQSRIVEGVASARGPTGRGLAGGAAFRAS